MRDEGTFRQLSARLISGGEGKGGDINKVDGNGGGGGGGNAAAAREVVVDKEL